MMASDTDWVEDVRRWYFNGGHAAAKRMIRNEVAPSATIDAAGSALGYEAANPTLQGNSWCDTGSPALTELR